MRLGDSIDQNGACLDTARSAHSWTRARAAILVAVVVVAWVVLDQASKAFFAQFSLGQDIGGPYLGLFRFTLVHNTGAAWGLFGDSTLALGFVSIAFSFVVAAFSIAFVPKSNWVLTLGASLVAAGGIGNAIDRFSLGYVIDFIDFAFIDFPVFNVADIGVTCGMVLIFIAVFFFWRESDTAANSESAASDKGSGDGHESVSINEGE